MLQGGGEGGGLAPSTRAEWRAATRQWALAKQLSADKGTGREPLADELEGVGGVRLSAQGFSYL